MSRYNFFKYFDKARVGANLDNFSYFANLPLFMFCPPELD